MDGILLEMYIVVHTYVCGVELTCLHTLRDLLFAVWIFFSGVLSLGLRICE